MRESRSGTEPRSAPADWRLHALALATVLVACSPVLVGNWVGGHDEYSYLWRAAEFRAQLAAGDLWPRWCPNFFWGFGYPFFVFYPPVVFLISSLVALAGLDVRWGLLLTGALGSALLFYGSHRLAKLVASETAARFGAAAATVTTYRFVQLYVRGDQAEALATGLIPWALTEAVLLGRRPTLGAGLRLAAAVAAISLTHTLTAVMTCGVLAVVGAAHLVRGMAGRGAFLAIAGASVSGLGLSGAYWLPVLVHRPLVRTEQMTDRVPGAVSYWWADHFPTVTQRLWSRFDFGMSLPGPDDGMALSTAPLAWALFAIAVLVVIAAPRDPNAGSLRPWLLGWVGVQALLLPISTPLWAVVPGLAWFQFPWRFLLLETVLLAPIGALVVDRLAPRRAWVVVLPVLLAAPTSWAVYVHAQSDPDPLGPIAHRAMADPAALRVIQQGSAIPLTTAGRNEYLPRAVRVMPTGAPRIERLEELESHGASRRYRLRAAADGEVALPWFDFPGITARVNGVTVAHTHDDRGVVTVPGPLAAGALLEVAYTGSPAESVGTGLGASAWLIWLGLWGVTRRGRARAADLSRSGSR